MLCRGIGWARRRERAEHFHAPAAARTGVEAAVPGLPGVVTVVGRYASRDGDQLAAKGEFLGTMTIAEKTVMAPFRPSSSNIYTPAGRFCLSAMSMGLLRSWSGSGMPDWYQTTLSRFAINRKRGSKTNKPGVLKGSIRSLAEASAGTSSTKSSSASLPRSSAIRGLWRATPRLVDLPRGIGTFDLECEAEKQTASFEPGSRGGSSEGRE